QDARALPAWQRTDLKNELGHPAIVVEVAELENRNGNAPQNRRAKARQSARIRLLPLVQIGLQNRPPAERRAAGMRWLAILPAEERSEVKPIDLACRADPNDIELSLFTELESVA